MDNSNDYESNAIYRKRVNNSRYLRSRKMRQSHNIRIMIVISRAATRFHMENCSEELEAENFLRKKGNLKELNKPLIRKKISPIALSDTFFTHDTSADVRYSQAFLWELFVFGFISARKFNLL